MKSFMIYHFEQCSCRQAQQQTVWMCVSMQTPQTPNRPVLSCFVLSWLPAGCVPQGPEAGEHAAGWQPCATRQDL